MNLRHSLLARLLAGSVLVAVCAITATAWLTMRNTTGAIRQEQGRTLADDTRAYDTLLGYAAQHPSWNDAAATVRELARSTGRRIALTSENGTRFVDSAPSSGPLPTRASAVVDPLAVDVALVPAGADRVDPRAVAPFGLPAAERARLLTRAKAQAACMNRSGQDARIAYGLSGRPFLQTSEGAALPRPAAEVCRGSTDDTLTKPEDAALRRLNAAVDRCLKARGASRIYLQITGEWNFSGASSRDDRPLAQSCLTEARRAQLRRYVAPTALLFIGSGNERAEPRFTAGTGSVMTAATLVLILTVGVSVLLGTRLIRPLHQLTGAAQRMRDGDRSIRVRTRDKGEVGRLATAFNDMSAHLDQVERQRRAMIGDISHELRTPLTNLRGWLEAAQDGVADLDPELLAALVSEILLLQHIVGDLQELALADAGELRLHPEPLNLKDLLDQVAAAHRTHDGPALLTESPDIHLTADPARLRQALGNLVANALRHTPPDGRVTLSGRTHENNVIIEVADTGTGMAPEDLPHIFDRFWRADPSRTRQTGGSGLGLAIVRSLVTAHGGTITATSAPGRGTTFTLTLPFASSVAAKRGQCVNERGAGR